MSVLGGSLSLARVVSAYVANEIVRTFRVLLMYYMICTTRTIAAGSVSVFFAQITLYYHMLFICLFESRYLGYVNMFCILVSPDLLIYRL